MFSRTRSQGQKVIGHRGAGSTDTNRPQDQRLLLLITVMSSRAVTVDLTKKNCGGMGCCD